MMTFKLEDYQEIQGTEWRFKEYIKNKLIRCGCNPELVVRERNELKFVSYETHCCQCKSVCPMKDLVKGTSDIKFLCKSKCKGKVIMLKRPYSPRNKNNLQQFGEESLNDHRKVDMKKNEKVCDVCGKKNNILRVSIKKFWENEIEKLGSICTKCEKRCKQIHLKILGVKEKCYWCGIESSRKRMINFEIGSANGIKTVYFDEIECLYAYQIEQRFGNKEMTLQILNEFKSVLHGKYLQRTNKGFNFERMMIIEKLSHKLQTWTPEFKEKEQKLPILPNMLNISHLYIQHIVM